MDDLFDEPLPDMDLFDDPFIGGTQVNEQIPPESLSAKLEKLKLLERKRDLLKQNPVLAFTPNPGQQALITAFNNPECRTFVWETGNRSGKTEIACQIAVACARGFYPFLPATDANYHTPFSPDTIHPDGSKGVRISIASTPKELEQTIQHAINRMVLDGEVVSTHKNGQTGVMTRWTFKNGSIITCYSYKQDPDEYEGSKCHVWIFNEPPPKKIYIAAKRGLVDFMGKAIIAGTIRTQPWITRDIVTRAKKGDQRFWHQKTSSHINIGYGITEKGLKDYADELSEVEYRIRILGESIAISGVVVSEYDPAQHLLDEPRLYAPEWFPGNEWPAYWATYAALDPHPAKPWHFLLVGVDPAGTAHLIKELYWKPRTDKEAASDILNLTEGYFVAAWLIDPMANAPSVHNRDYTLTEALVELGIPFENGTKDRSNGIFNIKRLFKIDPQTGPKVKIWPRLQRVRDELESWLWADPEETDVEEMQFKAKANWDDAMSNLYRILAIEPQHFSQKDQLPPLPDWETF